MSNHGVPEVDSVVRSGPGPSPVPPTVSVVVPVRNGMPLLGDQLRALAAQTCAAPWEVVVADNGSIDGTAAAVSAWAERDPRFRWIDAAAVPGAPAARNAGVRAAQGSLLAFCDADDTVLPGWLAACTRALENADVVAGVFDFRSLNGLSPATPVPASMRQLPFLPAGLGANLAVRRAAFDAVDGFAEDLATGEDIDLCWRLQMAGFRFALDEGAVVAKRDRTGFGDIFRQGYAFGRGGAVLYRRHRANGARRNLSGAARSWLWILIHVPAATRAGAVRSQWARATGMRWGRLVGSVTERVFFP